LLEMRAKGFREDLRTIWGILRWSQTAGGQRIRRQGIRGRGLRVTSNAARPLSRRCKAVRDVILHIEDVAKSRNRIVNFDDPSRLLLPCS